MSWVERHRESERLAAEAEAATLRGDGATARTLYAQAAREEFSALTYVGADKPRTLGITAVSAAALFYHAGNLAEAERVAHHASTLASMPGFALSEIARVAAGDLE